MCVSEPVKAFGSPAQPGQFVPSNTVQGREREEGHVAQLGNDPTRRDLHGDLDLGLVARLQRACWDDGRILMRRHPGISPVMAGSEKQALVTPDFRLPNKTIAGCRTAEKGEAALIRPDPVGQYLRERRFGVRVARRAKGCDEHFAGAHLARRGVDDIDRRARVVDEHLLAGHVRLLHRRRQLAFPRSIKFGEPAASSAIGMEASILFPY
jgi:hypothetical protein